MVVVLEGRHVVRPFHRLRAPGRQHERLVGDPHERRGAELDAIVIQQNESAGVVQAVVEALGRDADRASRSAHERDGVGELKGLRHPLKVHRHLVVYVTLPDLRACDGVDVAHRHAICFRHLIPLPSGAALPTAEAGVDARCRTGVLPHNTSNRTGPGCSWPSRASSPRIPAGRPA